MVKWDASDYRRHSSAQAGWARELLAKLSLVGTERVLDLGCGDGKITAEVARMVPDGSVVGIDKSREMIAFAAKTFPADEWPNLSFTVMDASELAFDREFDLVFSNATLHWVVDHRPVLRGIAAALKPGGRCLLQMGGRGNAAGILEVLTSGPIHERWGHHYADLPFPYGFYGPEEYGPWLKEAGLRPVRVELLPKQMVQAGAEGLAGWFRTTWTPWTHRIPSDKRDQFVAESVEAYLAVHPLDDQGRAHVAMLRLEVEAVGRSADDPA